MSQDEIMLKDADILNTNFSFDDKIEVATKVAKSLQRVIEEQKLAIEIPSKQGPQMYVTAEGWEVLGTMLGCTPYVEEVVEIPTNGPQFQYKATVSIRQGDNILSRASAMAERNNIQKDRPSVYSMAQTRALGKSYRMALSWIIKMAGYEPTPAEEMPYTQQKKPTVRDLKERKQQQREQQRIQEDESEPVEAEIVEPRHKPRLNNDLQTPDPEPLRTIVNKIIRILRNEGREPIRKNIWIKATECCKDGRIKAELKDDLQEYIMSHCPEELE